MLFHNDKHALNIYHVAGIVLLLKKKTKKTKEQHLKSRYLSSFSEGGKKQVEVISN